MPPDLDASRLTTTPQRTTKLPRTYIGCNQIPYSNIKVTVLEIETVLLDLYASRLTTTPHYTTKFTRVFTVIDTYSQILCNNPPAVNTVRGSFVILRSIYTSGIKYGEF